MKGLDKEFTRKEAKVIGEKFLKLCDEYPVVEITQKEGRQIMASGLLSIMSSSFTFFSKCNVGEETYHNCALVKIVKG